MRSYIVLLRGVNVGGKSKLSMADLKAALTEMGCQGVATYINSGNVLLKSGLDATALGSKIETLLTDRVGLVRVKHHDASYL